MSGGSIWVARPDRSDNRLFAAPKAPGPTRRCSVGADPRPRETAAIAIISCPSRNRRCRPLCINPREIWLKSPELLPTFASDRDVVQKCAGIAPDFEHLHTFARCPDGLPAAVRRAGSFPPALRKNP